MSLKNNGGEGLKALLKQVEQLRALPTPIAPTETHTSISDETVAEVQKHTERIVKMTDELKMATTSNERENLLLSLAEQISLMDMTLRENLLDKRDEHCWEREKALVKGAKIVVSSPQNTLLRISLPPMIGRELRGAYNTYWKLKSALALYMQEYKIPNVEGEKLVLIYKKYTVNLDIGYVCDNDNWEMKRTTNAIAEALNYSDNPMHFSMVYTTVLSSANYVEATVVLQKNFPQMLDYIKSNVPEQLPWKA